MKQIGSETGPAQQTNEYKQGEALRSCFSPFFVAMMIAKLIGCDSIGQVGSVLGG